MGGAIWKSGNVSPLAEYNFWFDPAAVHTVFSEAGLSNIVQFPVDVTEKICLTEKDLEQVGFIPA